MGNKKNRRNKKYSMHKSSRAYVKKKLPSRKPVEKIQPESTGEASSSGFVMQGSRVVNIENMKEYAAEVARHAASCGGSIDLTCESRNGLASVFSGECSTCEHSVTLETSKKVKGPKGYNRSVNKLAEETKYITVEP